MIGSKDEIKGDHMDMKEEFEAKLNDALLDLYQMEHHSGLDVCKSKVYKEINDFAYNIGHIAGETIAECITNRLKKYFG